MDKEENILMITTEIQTTINRCVLEANLLNYEIIIALESIKFDYLMEAYEECYVDDEDEEYED